MNFFFLLLLLFSLRTHGTRTGSNGGSPPYPEPDRDPVLVLEPDLSAVLRRVDPRFLSVTVDASLAAEESFMALLSSSKVRTLSAALSPAFLRFGGTRQDFMEFNPERVQWTSESTAAAHSRTFITHHSSVTLVRF
ncbi:heparanase-like [Stegastes partitus]|uniref:Heparanase-like n=1 Tax=Stegastes partitus TaxID=144197 RepID=A0A9Y4NEM9_9TELE|nr:PREDICTED: heparanase-like [Stegastes partitus]